MENEKQEPKQKYSTIKNQIMAPENLNLAFHEKRLIEKALLKTNGNVTKAYGLNVPKGNYMSYRTYLYKINHVYKIDKKKTNENQN